jgi:hypothetical protein
MAQSPYILLALVFQAVLLDAVSSISSSQNSNHFALAGQELITDTMFGTLKGNPPVPPSMRCVAAITVLYFSAYFAIILARSYSTLAGRAQENNVRVRGRLTLSQSTETGMTEALVLAPMLCILMIGARMRAMQLDPANGNPQPWAQSAMYVATWAFVVQFLARCTSPCIEAVSGEDGQGCAVSYLLMGIRVIAITFLYCGFTAVAISVFLIEAPHGETPPVSPAMQCVTTLTTVYFLIYLCIGIVRSFQQCKAWLNKTEYRPHIAEKYLEHASTALQFAPMFCILAVGCRLRALQMGREPLPWAQGAMYAATWAIVLQTALLILVPCLIPGENLDVQQDTKGLDWSKQPHPTLKGLSIALSCLWWASVLCLYVSIAMILVHVFHMEKDPLHLFKADVKDRPLSLLARSHLNQAEAPPVSTAMRCVTVLTLLYFGVFLVILVLRAVKDQSAQRRLEVFVDLAKQALAFVPMLCVMMIALRLRAVQLLYHDPQVFAQHTMWVATSMIIIQVVVAIPMVLLAKNENDESDEEEQDDDDEGRNGLCLKASVIVMLSLRYAAALGLYLSMAVLIFALFAMEPHPAETISMVPDLGVFTPGRMSNNKPGAF